MSTLILRRVVADNIYSFTFWRSTFISRYEFDASTEHKISFQMQNNVQRN